MGWVRVGCDTTSPLLQSRHQISQHGIKVAAGRRVMAQTNVVSFPQPHYHLEQELSCLEQHVWTLIPCSQAKPPPRPLIMYISLMIGLVSCNKC